MPTNRTLAALAITVREQPRMNPTSRQNDGALRISVIDHSKKPRYMRCVLGVIRVERGASGAVSFVMAMPDAASLSSAVDAVRVERGEGAAAVSERGVAGSYRGVGGVEWSPEASDEQFEQARENASVAVRGFAERVCRYLAE